VREAGFDFFEPVGFFADLLGVDMSR